MHGPDATGTGTPRHTHRSGTLPALDAALGLREVVRAAAAHLAASPAPSVREDAPRLVAELFVARALGISRGELVLRMALEPAAPVAQYARAAVAVMLDRRLACEPVAHILGGREFYGRDFMVTPHTLVPRPETELLVETALALAPRNARFADGGTGTGCIAITLCAERTDLAGIACDISQHALAVAAHNAATILGTGPARARCLPVLADFTLPLFREGSLDLLVSNPPYISDAEHAGLAPEVRDHEPVTALVPRAAAGLDAAALHRGRADGLGHVRALEAEARRVLRPGGFLLVEFGCTQGGQVSDLFAAHASAWRTVDIRRDLAGLDRFVVAQREP